MNPIKCFKSFNRSDIEDNRYHQILLGIVILSVVLLLPLSGLANPQKITYLNISDGVRPITLTFNISNSTGTNNNTFIYGNGLFNPDFSDVIIKQNNITVLPWAINTTRGTITINVTGNGTVGLLFNDSSPVACSLCNNSNETYSAWDNFSFSTLKSNWTSGGTGSAAIVGAALRVIADEWVNYGSFSIANTSIGYVVQAQFMTPSGNPAGTNDADVCIRATTAKCGVADGTGLGWQYTKNTNTLQITDNAVSMASVGLTLTQNVWYETELIVYPDNSTEVRIWQQGTTKPSTPTLSKAAFTSASTGTALQFVSRGTTGATTQNYDDVMVRRFNPNVVTNSWSSPVNTFSIAGWNNISSNGTHDIDVLSGTYINFSILGFTIFQPHNYTWYIDGVDQLSNTTTIISLFSDNSTHVVLTVAQNSTAGYANFTWNVTSHNYSIGLLNPANTSTGVTTPTTLTWREWPNGGLSHTYYVSTDPQFINIISSGIVSPILEIYSVSVNLNNNIKYYWKVKNATGVYSSVFEFTTAITPTVPGRLNISVFDEQAWNQPILTFSAQLYNATSTINKSTSTGWVNFTASEVSSGQYLVRIVPNSTYASRSVLATSPGNVSVWLPSTQNTIDTIAFYLLDYTNKYPWDISTLTVTKNNSVMHSAFFDSDAKVAVYLIRGDSYGITVTNPSANTAQNWGNYISTGSGNVEVVIMNIGVNSTLSNPFTYKVTWTSANITLQWNDTSNFMTSINYSIYKGTGRTLVHQLITSVDVGSSEYINTSAPDIYYVYVSAVTTSGWRNQTYVVDYRTFAPEVESSNLHTWSYGSVTIPAWIKNAFAVIALMILAGSFGALHRGEGGIITSIMSLFFWKWGWLSAYGAGAGFLGGLLLFAIIYHLDSKRKGAGYF